MKTLEQIVAEQEAFPSKSPFVETGDSYENEPVTTESDPTNEETNDFPAVNIDINLYFNNDMEESDHDHDHNHNDENHDHNHNDENHDHENDKNNHDQNDENDDDLIETLPEKPNKYHLLEPEFMDLAKEILTDRRAVFPEDSYTKWSIDTKIFHQRKKRKQQKEKPAVQGYRYKDGTDICVVYEKAGFKRLARDIKGILQGQSGQKGSVTKRKNKKGELVVTKKFSLVKLTTRKILFEEPMFQPLKEMVNGLPFSDNSKMFKAQGEHLVNYFKVFCAKFENDTQRTEMFQEIENATEKKFHEIKNSKTGKL